MKKYGSMVLAACSAAAIGIVGCGTDGVSKTEEILSDGSNLLVKRQVVPTKTFLGLRRATDQIPGEVPEAGGETEIEAGGGMPFDVGSFTGGADGAGAGSVGSLDGLEIGGAGDALGTEFGGAGNASGTEFGGAGDLSGLEFGGPASGPLATTGRRGGAFGGSADLASAFCNFFSAFCDYSVGCIDELASGTEEAEFGKAMLQGVCAPFQGPQCADMIQAGLDEAGAAVDQIPPETADILDCLADEISSASCTNPGAALSGDACGLGEGFSIDD